MSLNAQEKSVDNQFPITFVGDDGDLVFAISDWMG